MSQFVPRLTPPSTSNLYYIKTTHGGYNKCIVIDNVTGSVLPNCTGYAWGRFMECQDNVTDCNLSRGDGGVWYNNTSDGYQRGQTPKLGAVICWEKSGGSGHVAIVEKIKANGDIETSNSAYNGSRFFTKSLKASNNYRYGSSYTFQGFIYNPTDFEHQDSKDKKKKFKWVLYSRKLRNKRKFENI